MREYFNKEFLCNNKELVAKVAVIALIIIVTFFVFVLKQGESKEDVYLEEQASTAEEAAKEKGQIVVDVGGAVKNPKVVELTEGCRIEDAIEAAGGLTEDADLSNVNRAAFIEDGEKIYIPEKGGEAMAGMGSEGSFDDKVNLNTATSEELQTLNGVGPATAEKILNYRQENGSFRSIEDLKNISGIGDKTFEKLKDHIGI